MWIQCLGNPYFLNHTEMFSVASRFCFYYIKKSAFIFMTHKPETHRFLRIPSSKKNELTIILHGIVLYLEILSCFSPISCKFPKSFLLQMFHSNYTYPNNMFFPALVKKKIKIKKYIFGCHNLVFFTVEASCVLQRYFNSAVFYLETQQFQDNCLDGFTPLLSK